MLSKDNWQAAKQYFDDPHNRGKMKMPRGTNDIPLSVVKIQGKLYALGSKSAAFLEKPTGKIGEGNFGNTYYAISEEGKWVAIKVEAGELRDENSTEYQVMHLLEYVYGQAQRDYSREPRKPGKPSSFKDSFIRSKLYTVMELKDGKELFQYLYADAKAKQRKDLTEIQKLIIAYQCMRVVEFLHSKRIVHGDLKPENMMATLNGNQIILSAIDFGFSLIIEEGKIKIGGPVYRGTPNFMAPEIIETGTFSYASDVFALGKIMEIDLELPLYDGMIETQRLQRQSLQASMLRVILTLGAKKDNPNFDNHATEFLTNVSKEFLTKLDELDVLRCLYELGRNVGAMAPGAKQNYDRLLAMYERKFAANLQKEVTANAILKWADQLHVPGVNTQYTLQRMDVMRSAMANEDDKKKVEIISKYLSLSRLQNKADFIEETCSLIELVEGEEEEIDSFKSAMNAIFDDPKKIGQIVQDEAFDLTEFGIYPYAVFFEKVRYFALQTLNKEIDKVTDQAELKTVFEKYALPVQMLDILNNPLALKKLVCDQPLAWEILNFAHIEGLVEKMYEVAKKSLERELDPIKDSGDDEKINQVLKKYGLLDQVKRILANEEMVEKLKTSKSFDWQNADLPPILPLMHIIKERASRVSLPSQRPSPITHAFEVKATPSQEGFINPLFEMPHSSLSEEESNNPLYEEHAKDPPAAKEGTKNPLFEPSKVTPTKSRG